MGLILGPPFLKCPSPMGLAFGPPFWECPKPMLPILKYSPPMGYPFVKHEVNIEHPLQTCCDSVVDELQP